MSNLLLRYFHQCGSFSGARPLPFLIRLCIFDHFCLNDLNLILHFSIEFLSFYSLNPESCSVSSNDFLTHSKTSLLEDFFKDSFPKAIFQSQFSQFQKDAHAHLYVVNLWTRKVVKTELDHSKDWYFYQLLKQQHKLNGRCRTFVKLNWHLFASIR